MLFSFIGAFQMLFCAFCSNYNDWNLILVKMCFINSTLGKAKQLNEDWLNRFIITWKFLTWKPLNLVARIDSKQALLILIMPTLCSSYIFFACIFSSIVASLFFLWLKCFDSLTSAETVFGLATPTFFDDARQLAKQTNLICQMGFKIIL